jgi:hypothetical protein
VSRFPVFARCSQDHFLQCISDVCAVNAAGIFSGAGADNQHKHPTHKKVPFAVMDTEAESLHVSAGFRIGISLAKRGRQPSGLMSTEVASFERRRRKMSRDDVAEAPSKHRGPPTHLPPAEIPRADPLLNLPVGIFSTAREGWSDSEWLDSDDSWEPPPTPTVRLDH